MRLRLAFAFALTSLLATGCYFQDDCVVLQGNEEADPAPGYRNPYTGRCEFIGGMGGGGGDTCGDFGGPVAPQDEDRAPAFTPDWGICYGFCESLGEADCLAAADCRGAYVDDCAGAGCDESAPPEFAECWAISSSDPFSQAGCDTYDAEECARHSECAAVHAVGPAGGYGDFAYCADEPGTVGDAGSCIEEAFCEIVPPECPEGSIPGVANGCYTGVCIPFDECDALPACSAQSEAQCVLRGDCEPVYEGIDCTCEGEDCTCADWIFEACN